MEQNEKDAIEDKIRGTSENNWQDGIPAKEYAINLIVEAGEKLSNKKVKLLNKAIWIIHYHTNNAEF